MQKASCKKKTQCHTDLANRTLFSAAFSPNLNKENISRASHKPSALVLLHMLPHTIQRSLLVQAH